VEAAERARDARRHYEAATAGERGQNAG
jgi:hypothetical protein